MPFWVLAVSTMSCCVPLRGSDQHPKCLQSKAAKALQCSRATIDLKAFKGGRKKTCSDTTLVWLNGEPLGN